MNTFLSNAEIKELTGYTYKSLQCQELARMGIKFIINPRFGNPKVLRKELEAKGCSGSTAAQASIDLDALKVVS